MDSTTPANGLSPRVRRVLRATIVLGWGITFFMALAFDSTQLFTKGPAHLPPLKAWARFLTREYWPLLSLCSSVAAVFAAALLLWRSEEEPRPAPPQGWGGAFVRGVVLAALLSGSLALYLALGGHDILYYYPYTPVGTAALLAPVLGWISLLEGKPAERLRAQVGWSLLIALLAVVAMLVAWIQREYVNELFLRGFENAFEHALEKLLDLGGSPLWTLAHFAWISVPVGCSAFTRLRPRGDRVWLALALTGVLAPWSVRLVPAGDAVIATTSVLICLLTPIAWRLGDRVRERLAELLFSR